MANGPLDGVRIIELQGIGPGPFCGMMLSDMGADVIRIDRAANVPVASGAATTERGTNLLDTGSHFYDVYETADGRYVSFGSIEPQFYAELLELSGLGEERDLPSQLDRSRWPEMKERVAALVRRRTQAEWCTAMEGSDVCFAPVLTMAEAAGHPHNVARATYVDVAGISQPAPAPRFSRTPPAVQSPPGAPGSHTDEVLADFGIDVTDAAKLRASGAVA